MAGKMHKWWGSRPTQTTSGEALPLLGTCSCAGSTLAHMGTPQATCSQAIWATGSRLAYNMQGNGIRVKKARSHGDGHDGHPNCKVEGEPVPKQHSAHQACPGWHVQGVKGVLMCCVQGEGSGFAGGQAGTQADEAAEIGMKGDWYSAQAGGQAEVRSLLSIMAKRLGTSNARGCTLLPMVA